MRRALALFLVLTAALLGWTGSFLFDHPILAPSRALTPGLDGPATGRWTIRAPAAPKAPVPPTPGLANDPLATLESGIAAREYHATRNRDGLQAPNRAHGFRTYFEPNGVRVVERSVGTPAELVALRLERTGREGHLDATRPGEVSAHGARVEIRRDRDLVEWYENSARGLEQGFTFAAPPAGGGALVLELAIADAHVHAAGGDATFETPAGRSLRYTDLAAVDAHGRSLPAHLATDDAHVRLVIDDADAAYPVTIDPLLAGTVDTQLGIAQANSGFGTNCANGGDVNGDGCEDLLVGCPSYDSGQTDEGAVFLFLGGPKGIANFATPSAILQSDQLQGFMGYDLAAADVNGDGYSDVLAGAYGYSSGQAAEGVVLVFQGGPAGIANGTPVNASAMLQVNLAGHSFGQAVANAGDVNGDGYEDVLVGAPTGNGGPDAYVFLGGAAGVATTPATTLSGTPNDIAFGWSVVGAGDINADGYADICVADPQYNNGQANEGALFTWLGGPTGIASGAASTAQSILETNQANWYLGRGALAAAGDVNGDGFADVVVGSLNWTNGESGEGAALVLKGSATAFGTGTIAAYASAKLEMNQASAGVARVAAGDVNGDGYSDIVVGSASYDVGATSNCGAVAVYLGGPNGVVNGNPSTAFAFLHDGQAAEAFGVGLAVGDWNGDGRADVAVGASGYDAGQANDGAVFVYSGEARGIASTFEVNASGSFQSNQAGAQFGHSVASGDVNGDGYSDLIIGAPYYDAGETDEGAAFLFLGSSSGIFFGSPADAATTLQSNQAGAGFGWSVASAGDVNDDGFADVIVGSPGHDLGETNEGAVFVFLGSASGVANGDPSTAATTLQSNQAGAQFGTVVAGVGDVNGDGHVDVAVSAPLYDGLHGGVFVFHGTATGIPSGDLTTAARTLESTQTNTGFGNSIAGAGDWNGDGYADLIVGEPFASTQPGLTQEGLARIYKGSASGISQFDVWSLLPTLSNGSFGCSVAGAGDVNGDGLDDVIVGAERYFSNGAGEALVFHGKPGPGGGATSVPNGAVFGAAANAHLGNSVAGIGDVNGDGYADVAAGAWNQGGGIALVQHGGPFGVVGSTPSATLTSTNVGAELGAPVAAAGDVNGDGFADLLVGAAKWDFPQVDEGGAFLWNGNGGLPVRPSRVRQKRGDGSGVAVQPWNRSHANGVFSGSRNNIDPFSRGRVKFEIETCPQGMAFDSSGCTRQVSPTWTDAGFGSGNPGVELAMTPTLTNAGLYHWRARTLYAPLTVTQPGIAARPHPAHGPWRRNEAGASNEDFRIDAVVLAVDRPGTSADFAIAPIGNPARGRIVLAATLPNSESAEVALFDVAGRQVVTRSITGSPGRQTLTLARGGELPAGVYLVRLTQGGRTASTRVVFVR